MKSVLVAMLRAKRNTERRISRFWLSLNARRASHPMVRLGSEANGWYAPEDLPAGALCYCIGVGDDASFDFKLADLGAEVHSFDPTPPSIEYMASENNGRVSFHPWGLLDKDGEMRLHFPVCEDHSSYFQDDLHLTRRYYEVPCFRMETILKKLGHSTPFLLKIDIEGSWYSAVPDIMDTECLPDFLMLEYDSPAPVHRVAHVNKTLQAHGYGLVLREGDNAVYKKLQD